MFPEYRELISKLKTTDRHFAKLFNKHSELDQEIRNLGANLSPIVDTKIELMKKEKLKLKDEIYSVLRQRAIN